MTFACADLPAASVLARAALVVPCLQLGEAAVARSSPGAASHRADNKPIAGI